jgi:putative membrane protein insertion efficiency factor
MSVQPGFPASPGSGEEGDVVSLPERLVLLYQRRVSAHDGARCLFHPTCSEYYLQALDTYGFFRATLMFVDRILYRENAHAARYYPLRAESGRLFDPVLRGDRTDSRESPR